MHEYKTKYQIGDILEGSHIPSEPIHLLIEDIIYAGINPVFYSIRNLQEDMVYDKLIKRMDNSLYYKKVG